MSLFTESEVNSVEKNNLIRDLNRVYDVISNASKFKNGYFALESIISGIDERCKQYSTASKKAIKCDIVDGAIESTSFDQLAENFKEKMKNKTPPNDSLVFTPLTINSDLEVFDLEEYSTDELEAMQANFPSWASAAEGTKEAKRGKNAMKEVAAFYQQQTDAIEYMKSFMSQFEDFENGIVNFRDNGIQQVKNNIPYIENVHYNAVYNFTVKKLPLPDYVNVGGKSIKFVKKQSDFIKKAINELVMN